MESTSVLNTIAASGADVTLANRQFNITGFPAAINYLGITTVGAGLLPPLVETPQVKTITFTASNSVTYSFYVQQNVDDNQISFPFTYTSDSTATAAEIALAITSAINNNPALRITASGTSTTITVTADAGYPFFTITANSNVTVADAMPTIAPHATAATAIAGTTTVTVTTAAAHGLATGQTVAIAGVATMTLTQNGVSGLSAVTARITYASSTTFTLDGVTGTGTNSGTITITKVAQADRGNGADLLAAGVSGALAANNYAALVINYNKEIPNLINVARASANQQTIYVSANLAASPYTATTNYSTFVTALNEKLAAYVTSTTNADPEAIAVA